MSGKLRNVMLMGAGFTTSNMGVWALASGAVTSVWHAYPDAKINFLDYNAIPASYKVIHHGGSGDVRLINLRFSKKFWLPNSIARLLLTVLLINVIPFRSLRDRLYSRNLWLHHIREADLVGSIAGGDSFSDIYGINRLIYVALPQILVLLMGKPLILLPQTIGPFKSPFGKILARLVLRRARKVHTRDQEGVCMIPELLGCDYSRITFCYDMGFVLKGQIVDERMPAWLADITPDAPVVGINVSGLLHIGGYTRKNMFGLKGDYSKMIHELIALFVQKHNAHIMLIPHVLGDTENSESDVSACHAIFRESKAEFQNRLHVVEDGYNHHELKALIGRCNFFLGSRMHACIAALSQCIPAVGLAYSRKFQGVFESVGVQDLVLDLRVHDEKAIVALADSLYQRGPEFRTRLHKKMPEVQSTVFSLFDGFDNESI